MRIKIEIHNLFRFTFYRFILVSLSGLWVWRVDLDLTQVGFFLSSFLIIILLILSFNIELFENQTL
jgi:hypothetical protein